MEAHAQADTYAACASEMAAARTHLFRHGGGCFDAWAATQRRARWGCADGGQTATVTLNPKHEQSDPPTLPPKPQTPDTGVGWSRFLHSRTPQQRLLG